MGEGLGSGSNGITMQDSDSEDCTRLQDLPDQAFEQVLCSLSPRSRASVFAASRATRDQVLRCSESLRMACELESAGCLRHAGLLHASACRTGSSLRLRLMASSAEAGWQELAACIQLGTSMNLVQCEPWSAVTRLDLVGFFHGPSAPSLAVMRQLPSAFPALYALRVSILHAPSLRPLVAALITCPFLHHLTVHASHARTAHWMQYSKFSDEELELSRDLPHALSRISQLRSLSMVVNVPPQDLAVLACLTDLTRLSIAGGEEWSPCTRFRFSLEHGEDYYEDRVFPLLAAMPALCELHADVGAHPYICFAQPLFNALTVHGGSLRVLSLPKLKLNTDLLGAVLEGAPQLEELTVCTIIPEASCADAPCRWRKLRLQLDELLDLRTLSFLPLHSLTEPLEIKASGICLTGATMHGGEETQVADVSEEEARMWAEAGVDNMARLTAGLKWQWSRPHNQPGRSFWISGQHPHCLWPVLEAALRAMRMGPHGAQPPCMEALSLKVMDEDVLPALGRIWGDEVTRLRVKGCVLPASFWVHVLEHLPKLDTLILAEVQIKGAEEMEAFTRFVATPPRALTVVVHGGVIPLSALEPLRRCLAALGAPGASCSTTSSMLGSSTPDPSGSAAPGAATAVTATAVAATAVAATATAAARTPGPAQLFLSCEHAYGSLPWEDSDEDNLNWRDRDTESDLNERFSEEGGFTTSADTDLLCDRGQSSHWEQQGCSAPLWF